ncbi:hypothetical protein QG37_07235 [Candidozyma auris]|uniref:Uncharacterized protein n=1 Tax=Candidozyma auris TaxID=498019 RepID=A0A0L0NQT3_CANAR|nr:hypothetical protein QG37_07235 [[Candida] auris]
MAIVIGGLVSDLEGILIFLAGFVWFSLAELCAVGTDWIL